MSTDNKDPFEYPLTTNPNAKGFNILKKDSAPSHTQAEKQQGSSSQQDPASFLGSSNPPASVFQQGHPPQPNMGFQQNPTSQPNMGFQQSPTSQPNMGFQQNPTSQPNMGFQQNHTPQPNMGFQQNSTPQPPMGAPQNPGAFHATQPSTSGSRRTKKCPYCAEGILAEAIICRFCGSNLVQGQSNMVPHNQQMVAYPQYNQNYQLANTQMGSGYPQFPMPTQVPTNHSVQQMLDAKLSPPKNPWIAVLLSFFIIGAGQIYNADGRKGAIMLLIAIVLVPATAGVLWLPLCIWSVIDAYNGAKNTGSRW